MSGVAVLIPVLARPHRVAPTVASLTASLKWTPARAVFLCSPGDDDEIAAVRRCDADLEVVAWPLGRGDYPRKINHGFRLAADRGYEWALLAADDLHFHPGWLEAALRAHARTGCCVVGTNDLGNRRVIAGRHATHSLVHRDYLACGTVDEPGRILTERYAHWFCDDEFCQTALWRRTFVAARDSVVEHLHPAWGKADDDDTYRKGQATIEEDRQLYESRKWMWGR